MSYFVRRPHDCYDRPHRSTGDHALDAYLALGLELGRTIATYGRLYDVIDTGASYTDKSVPMSQTRESTGMHTDSSGKNVCPRVIGPLCIRAAPRGGDSRVVSAAEVHERLRGRSPALLERLYGASRCGTS